jgi:DNA-binding LacI/PurR family transcriptional regulator
MAIEAIKTEKRLTISDIAAMAGVSKAAVSGVLNKKSRVGQETEKKILSIIKKYNYVPQDSARALSTKRTYQIGYLVSSQVTLGLANSTFATYLAGVGDCCQQRGYRMMASSYDMTKVENFLIVEKLRQRCVDGLILTGLFDSKIIDNLRSLKIPIIFIGGIKPI